MGTVFACNRLTDQMLNDIKHTLTTLQQNARRPPRIVTFCATNDSTAHSYLAQQQRTGQRLGIDVIPHDARGQTVEDIAAEADVYEHQDTSDGIIFLRPMDAALHHIAVHKLRPSKDIDCQGGQAHAILRNTPYDIDLPETMHLPPTGKACLDVLNAYHIPITRARIALFTNGSVGTPLKTILERQGATINLYGSKQLPTRELNADIIISTADTPCIHPHFIKPGTAVIDLARIPHEGKLTGSLIDYGACKDRAGLITPEPGTKKDGSIGAVMTAALFQNVTNSYKHGLEYRKTVFARPIPRIAA